MAKMRTARATTTKRREVTMSRRKKGCRRGVPIEPDYPKYDESEEDLTWEDVKQHLSTADDGAQEGEA